MDERVPTRDRLFYPLIDEPADKKRRVDYTTCGSSSSIIDTIVNATSTWPLNSLSSSVLPTYDESIAAKHTTTYLSTYYGMERYASHSQSHQYNNVLPERGDFLMDESYRLQESTHPVFGSQPMKESCLPLDNAQQNVPTSQERSFISINEESALLADKVTHDPMPTENSPLGTKDESSPLEDDMTLANDTQSKGDESPDIETQDGDSNHDQESINQENGETEETARKTTNADISCQSPPGVKMAEDAPTFQSPPVQNSNDSFSNVEVNDTVKVEVKEENEKRDDSDLYSFLDWKNGIATLPGSNLKFKLNEFGTLEMVSTVETDKGEYEWSTADSKPPPSEPPSDLMRGPPDEGKVLCCEVCGVYGLPQDFCSSGRFCSLSCVGAYTGRRNKGREFVRNINPVDRKISKKKKKGKGKKGANTKTISPLALDGEDSGFINGNTDVVTTSLKVKSPREKGKGRHKAPPVEATGTCLTASMVPYNFSKAFTWTDYLYTSGTKPVPLTAFKQENPDIDVFPMPCEEFKKNMKLEAVDPKHPSYICVCTIVRVKGSRLRLHFDGWSECYDFWTNADSPDIFPMGWCTKNGQTLHPPRSFTKDGFDWPKYLKKQTSVAAPAHLFQPVVEQKHEFEIGMKLEAIDLKNPDLICVATVTNVIGNRFLVHFDEWDDTYDYWCEEDCPYIHPIGWCESTGRRLTPPNDDEVKTFTWKQYLKTTGTKAAPPELFKIRVLPTFKPHQKLEAVDKRNPSLIRCTTVAEVLVYRIRLHFDGWDDVYDDWFDADSTDMHSVGYCEKTGHPLEPPLTTADKISSVACPTPGCKGIGHVKGAKYSSHHSTFGCPYSLQNLNKESCLVDRLSTNSMTEESDWSYASKNKTTVGTVKRGEVSVEGVCPTPGCDGSGHISGHWRTHQSSAGCPKNEANVIKIPRPPIPIQPAPLKEPSPTVKKRIAPVTIVTSSVSTKVVSSSAGSVRRPSREIKREKLSEKSPFKQIFPKKEEPSEKPGHSYQPWKETNDFDQTHAAHIPQNTDRKKSRERLRMSRWSIDDVVKHVTSLGCAEQAKLFDDQKIDGESFLLLTQDDLVKILKIKLGPALKIFKSIPKL